MATWTNIANSAVAVGAPLSTALMTALRDNVTAAFEGASGAPRLDPSTAIDWAGTGSGTGDTNAETYIRERIADALHGEIGTYATLYETINTGTIHNVGRTTAGSGLRFDATEFGASNAPAQVDGTPSGTWRLMGGGFDASGTGNTWYVSLWMRIS